MAKSGQRGLKAWVVPAILAAGVAAVAGVSRIPPGRMAFLEIPEAEAAAVKNVHEHEGRPLCQACHVKRDMRLTDEPNALCRRCHSFHSGNHPVDVSQRVPAEIALPLGPGGRVLCHTCHEPHGNTPERADLRLQFSALCLSCHPTHGLRSSPASPAPP